MPLNIDLCVRLGSHRREYLDGDNDASFYFYAETRVTSRNEILYIIMGPFSWHVRHTAIGLISPS